MIVVVRQSTNPEVVALSDHEGSSNWTAPSYNDAPSGPLDLAFGCFSDILSQDAAYSSPSFDYDLDGCFADILLASFGPLGESHYSDSGCFDDLDVHNPPFDSLQSFLS